MVFHLEYALFCSKLMPMSNKKVAFHIKIHGFSRETEGFSFMGKVFHLEFAAFHQNKKELLCISLTVFHFENQGFYSFLWVFLFM